MATRGCASSCSAVPRVTSCVTCPFRGAWAFDYDAKSSADDETGFKFDRHSFVPGEYVSVREHDGVQRTFFIKAVVELD